MGAVRLPGFRFRASFFLIGMAAARLQAASCPSTVFRQAPTTVLGGPAVGSADVNGDGLVDLASTASSGNQPAVAVFLSAGDGTFDSPINRIVPNGYSAFVLGDFDGDGKPDLVAKQGQYLAFFKGNGNATFQDEIDTNFPSYVYSKAIYAQDLDGDGKLDLLERLDGATTLFYKGKGNGAFFDPVIALLEKLVQAGAEIVDAYAGKRSIRARLPLGALELIAGDPSVFFIQPRQDFLRGRPGRPAAALPASQFPLRADASHRNRHRASPSAGSG